MNTILINPFDVPAEMPDEDFLADWAVAADYMKRQPGFLASRLHRALDPEGRYRFINVAEWESPAHFAAAVGTDEFRAIASSGPVSAPALYSVVREVTADETSTSVARSNQRPPGDATTTADAKAREPKPLSRASETRLAPGEGVAQGPAKRPTNFVAGVIHDQGEFDQAIIELTKLGIDRASLGILYGEAGADAIARRERHWFHELLGDEDSYVGRYEEEIRNGGFVVGIPISPQRDDERERVMSILRAHGAHFLVSGTRWTYAVDE